MNVSSFIERLQLLNRFRSAEKAAFYVAVLLLPGALITLLLWWLLRRVRAVTPHSAAKASGLPIR
jgi:hypothetical protein